MTIREYLDSVQNKKITVLGIGVSNKPLIRMLAAAGARVTAHDRKSREQMGETAAELEALGVRLVLGPDYLEGIDGEQVFRTPGMRPDLPQLEAARARGAQVTSEMEVFFRVCPCPIIAVTGSDGKTTTTTIISELLKAAGKTVWLGGNIGTPLLDKAGEMKAEDVCVLELSSFQLMTMDRSPAVAVITNLAPNHLDVHKDMAEYVDSKRNVFRHQDSTGLLVLNADNDITASMIGEQKGALRLFSRQSKPENGAWLDEAGNLMDTQRGLILHKDEIRLPGLHNVENFLAAFAAVRDFVSPEVMAWVARTFGGVEHRIEFVRELDGVRYYNDSIASSPSRTIAGLRSFPKKVILIAGGYDKHIPFDVLGPEITEHVKYMALCGVTAEKIRAAVESAPDYAPGAPEMEQFDNLTAAIAACRQQAQPGDVVLFSPACASFDQFPNFMARGKFFKEVVNNFN